MSKKEPGIKTVVGLCLITFLFRLVLSPFLTYERDVHSWIGWANRLREVGFKNFYSQGWCDYLPGYLYVLRFWGNLEHFLARLGFSVNPYILYKIPAILADVFTVGLVYFLARKWSKPASALLASLLYAFNPAILANSTLWGQIDSVNTLFYLLTLIALIEGKTVFSAFFLAVSCLIKPQGIVLIPLTALILFKKKVWKQFTIYYLLFALLFILLFLPFTPSTISHQSSTINFIFSRFQKSLDQYPYTSLNAFNLWGVNKMWWKQDDIRFIIFPYQIWGLLIFGLIYAWFLLVLWRRWAMERKNKRSLTINHQPLIIIAAFVFASLFLFPTRVHERHLFSLFPFLALAVTFLPRLRLIYGWYSVSYLLNLMFAYIWLTADFKEIFSPLLVTTFSLANLLAFAFLAKNALCYLAASEKTKYAKKLPIGPPKAYLVKENVFSRQFSLQDLKISQKTKRILVAGLLLTALFLRFFRLAVPQTLVFDEVYHGFTAGEFAEGNKEAWEWWTHPPPDVAYEWTHPPLAKLLMAGAIKIFGYNSYGWRFASAVAGVAALGFLFLLAQVLFKNFFVSLITGLLILADFMPLVMSRIAMNDIFFLAFMLGSLYFFAKFISHQSSAINHQPLIISHLLFTGFLWGCALASKWTAVYAVFIFTPFLLGRLKKLIISHQPLIIDLLVYFLSFVCLPIFVYLVSYFPFFLHGHSWEQFIHLQKQMWWYHTRLEATHPFTSPWWTWPLDIRPVWLFVDHAGDQIANIYCLGNPFVWWFGLGAVIYLLWRLIQQARHGQLFISHQSSVISHQSLTLNHQLLFVILGYFAFFLPWSVSPRIMFIYHYFPSLPFLYLATALVLNQIYFSKNKISLAPIPYSLDAKQLVLAYLIAVGTLFFLFYPHLTALRVPKSLSNFYFWLESWR